jgi:predicted NBD/HSP70 family sugar kinase
MPYVIGVDVGGSSIRAARIDSRTGKCGRVFSAKTPKTSAKEFFGLVAELSSKAAGSDKRAPVSICMPGIFDERGFLRNSINFPFFRDVNVDFGLQNQRALKETGLGPRRVYWANDAFANHLGIKNFGEGKSAKRLVTLVLGSGIGGVFGKVGSAGGLELIDLEPGHMVLGPPGSGIVESHAGMLAIQTLANAENGFQARKLANRGDKVAVRAYELAAENLGHSMHALHQLLKPDLTVLSGGPSKDDRYVSDALDVFGEYAGKDNAHPHLGKTASELQARFVVTKLKYPNLLGCAVIPFGNFGWSTLKSR